MIPHRPAEEAEAVREFRFARRLENEVEAYRLLIKLGLEAPNASASSEWQSLGRVGDQQWWPDRRRRR